jgi:serine/threonine-protein kinase RsbW
MTGPELDGGPPPGLELELPAKPAFVRTARHTVAALARLHDAPEDLIEDIKLAVSEACTAALGRPEGDGGSPREAIRLTAAAEAGRVVIDVIDPAGLIERSVAGAPSDIDTEDLPFDRLLALPLIRGLVDELAIDPEEPRGVRMRMIVRFDADPVAGSS